MNVTKLYKFNYTITIILLKQEKTFKKTAVFGRHSDWSYDFTCTLSPFLWLSIESFDNMYGADTSGFHCSKVRTVINSYLFFLVWCQSYVCIRYPSCIQRESHLDSEGVIMLQLPPPPTTLQSTFLH